MTREAMYSKPMDKGANKDARASRLIKNSPSIYKASPSWVVKESPGHRTESRSHLRKGSPSHLCKGSPTICVRVLMYLSRTPDGSISAALLVLDRSRTSGVIVYPCKYIKSDEKPTGMMW
jgi:hypothetical protein